MCAVPKPLWLTPTNLAGAVVPGVRRVAGTIAAMEAAWDLANTVAADADGPLWIALGDSSQVGVGASSRAATSVALGLSALRASTGQPWRVINLARHGAKLATLVAEQIPQVGRWGEPALVTVGAGANDVLWSFGLAPPLDAIELLLAALPEGAVAGTVPLGWTGKGARVNEHLRARAPDFGVHVSEAGVLPRGRRYLSADLLHPNDEGYRFIAERFWDAVAPLVEPDSAGPSFLQHGSARQDRRQSGPPARTR